MRKARLLVGSSVAFTMLLIIMITTQPFRASREAKQEWWPGDRTRPQPPIITPGTASTQAKAGLPPSDAIVLFNGKDLSSWEAAEGGGPAKWIVNGDYFIVAPMTGNIQTKQAYGDCQLHVEWATPNPPTGTDQGRGNSGVFLHGLYEIQVLDSYDNVTYADGVAGAAYCQYPPLANASRKPGEWQTFDIVFHGPRFDPDGKVTRRATVTVFYNGVLVQDHVALMGPTHTVHHQRLPYKPTPDKLPLALQDHHFTVRYRNIWIRELKEGE